MFSQESVCPQGVGISGTRFLPGGMSGGGYVRGRGWAWDIMGYNRQAGSTHPTGMLSFHFFHYVPVFV